MKPAIAYVPSFGDPPGVTLEGNRPRTARDDVITFDSKPE
jgi:hypothetical protein